MRWAKKGLIFDPRGKFDWASNYALQPTPIEIDGKIRIYCGFRDSSGISRVGYVDVDARDPKNALAISQSPVLDIGEPGMFDENGVVPCCAIKNNGKIYLYYAGYQLAQKIKFYVFGGLAISEDNGESFKRYTRIPITDRTDAEPFFRVIHSVIIDDGIFKVWYGAGDSFVSIQGKKYPSYNIRCMTSSDGKTFGNSYKVCIDCKNDEYRVARPWVIRDLDGFHMYYYIATKSDGFSLAYAKSGDGIEWSREKMLGMDRSEDKEDSKMIAYPSVITIGCRTYMFYNGNNYGEYGFGYAVLDL